jgi:hypothetical protein
MFNSVQGIGEAAAPQFVPEAVDLRAEFGVSEHNH